MEPSLRALREAVDELDGHPYVAAVLVSRLGDSVARPLDDIAGRSLRAPAETPPESPVPLWQLTFAITALGVANPDVLELAEASAAVQDLSLGPDQDEIPERRARLESMQAGCRRDCR